MSREYDIFYDAAGEGSWAEHRAYFALTVGSQDITSYPKSYNLNTSLLFNSQPLRSGTVLLMYKGDLSLVAHMELVEDAAAAASSLILRPLCSQGDVVPVGSNSVIGETFPVSSGLVSTIYAPSAEVGKGAYTEASRLVIDLTEAPEESYDYVVFGCGWINATIDNPALSGGTDSPSTTAHARMRICPPDDIYAGAGVNDDNDVYTENIVTITKASTKQSDLSTAWDYGYELDGGECYNAQVGGIVTLQGGQRYDLSLQFAGYGNGVFFGNEKCTEVVQMHQARMIAFRYDPDHAQTCRAVARNDSSASVDKVADGHIENLFTFTNTSATDYLNFAIPSDTSPPGGSSTATGLLTIGVATLANNQTTADANARVTGSLVSKISSSSNPFSQSSFTPNSTTDRAALSILRWQEWTNDDDGNRDLGMTVQVHSGSTGYARQGFEITFLPTLIQEDGSVQSEYEVATAAITSDGSWQSVGLNTGFQSNRTAGSYYIEGIGYSSVVQNPGVNTLWAAPVLPDSGGQFGRSSYQGAATAATIFGTSAVNRRRYDEDKTNISMDLENRYWNTSTNAGTSGVSLISVAIGDLAIRETPIADIPLDAATSVVAELLPGIGLKAWEEIQSSPSGGGKLYKTVISGAPEVKEVYRGLTKLTLSDATGPATTLGATDAWQYDSSSGTLYLQLADTYIPTASSAYIYAVTPIRVSLSTENIKIGGTYYPFEARMESLPGFSKTLSSSGGRFQNSVSLGKISLAAADGEFDNEFFDYIWQGRDANLWMGNSSVSDDLQDFKLIARATMMIPSWSTSKIDIGLLDKKVDLTKAVHQSSVDWISGALGATTTLKKQPVPVVYGEVQRIPAYKISSGGTGATDNAAYQFAANNCSSVRAVYHSADSTRSIKAANFDGGGVSDSALIGQVAITNQVIAALSSPVSAGGAAYSYSASDVPDTVYVDVLGQCDRDGSNNVTRNYFHLGEIGYDILTRKVVCVGEANKSQSAAPVRTTDIDKASFDLLDSKKRHTFVSSDDAGDAASQGYRETQEPVQVGLVIEADKTVAETFNSLCNGTFCYWKTNGAGRIAMDVADFYGGNLIVNGSAELPGSTASSTAIYPWKTLGTGTTIERKRVVIANDATRVPSFNGRYAIKLTSTEPIASGYAYQDVPLPKSGTYVLTFVGSAIDSAIYGVGQFTATITVRVFRPDGSYIDLGGKALPNPRAASFSIGGDAWARYAEEFEIEFGNSGIGQVALNCDWDFFGTSIDSIVALDMIQLFPVACVLTDENTIVSGMNFATENYYGYGVPFAARQAVNELGRKQSRVRTFVDIEAINGTFADTEFSEAKDLVESSGVAKLSDPILVGEEDADGVAAAGVTYYSRQRVNLSVKVLGLSRIPVIGEYVYMKSVSRVDSGPDEHPIWRIMSVAYDAKMPKTVSLKLEKPVDPVSDRMGTAYLP